MPAGTTSSWSRSATPSRQLMIALRNKVERRYEHDLKIATGGKAQALVMNYEQEMVAFFGSKYSLADRLRFPISLQALTAEGRKQLQEAAKKLPKHTRDVVAKFEADIDQAVLDDIRYDYRVRLVPIVGSKTEADLAIDFVKLDELTEEERKVMVEAGRRGMVIIKDRHVEVEWEHNDYEGTGADAEFLDWHSLLVCQPRRDASATAVVSDTATVLEAVREAGHRAVPVCDYEDLLQEPDTEPRRTRRVAGSTSPTGA
ncbi:DUF3644 domain-containing protein [Streptomyces sp. NPDC012450]|uniref:DUF3644 domain-containing protein n=1 Tax=Streptomyces sp. NPDC012450 TaxID=3364834 RepID=UPI0036E1FCB6